MEKTLRINGKNWTNWLQIKPSIIPGAGRGLFACRDIPARTVVGKYNGRVVDKLRDVYALKNDQYVFVAMSRNRRPVWIDGNVRSNYLRFVNGARSRSEQKRVNLEAYQYASILRFRSTRSITAGEELILDYGPDYWDTYSNADGIKHRNRWLLRQFEEALGECTDLRVRAALMGMIWLVRQMTSTAAYYSFFVEYLWMFYEFRLSKCHRSIVDLSTKLLLLELDGAQFRLDKMFRSTIQDKWRFISLIPVLFEVQAAPTEYAKFYRSFFPRSLKYLDVSFHEHKSIDDFEGMVEVLMDYCFLEMARRGSGRSRLFRLPEARFSEYWRAVRQFDLRDLEESVTNEDEQFELDYQATHLIMCRYGYGSGALAPPSSFDRQLAEYLVRHEIRILEESDDLDLIAELAYCYLELEIQKEWVRKAIDRILKTQNSDGSWGTEFELQQSMYDRCHQTWNAVTALCFSLAKHAS